MSTATAPSAAPVAQPQPALRPAQIPAIVLRGIAQVFFQPSVLTGAILAVALLVGSVPLGLLALLGSAVQALAAWALGERERVLDGRMGYNGALVGAASSLGFDTVNPIVLPVCLTIVGAAACVPAHLLWERLFASRALSWAGLPVSTAPFCTVAGMITAALAPLAVEDELPSTHDPLAGLGMGLTSAFSEVNLASGWVVGVITIIALFAASWKVGLAGLLGSAVGLLVSISMPFFGWQDVSTGLHGYAAVLAAIGLATVFLPQAGTGVRWISAVVGAALTIPLGMVMELTPIPEFTWPFLLASWIVLLVLAAARGRERSA